MNGGGIWAATPLSKHLLQEQLGTPISFYENLDEFNRALTLGQNTWFLREEQDAFSLKIRERDITLPKPVKLASFFGFLDRVSQTYSLGMYVFDPVQRTLSPIAQDSKAVSVFLREKESQLLLAFLETPDGFLTRESLLEAVWGVSPDALIETRTLESHIYQLRQKLESNAREPKILLSQEGGYRLVFQSL